MILPNNVIKSTTNVILPDNVINLTNNVINFFFQGTRSCLNPFNMPSGVRIPIFKMAAIKTVILPNNVIKSTNNVILPDNVIHLTNNVINFFLSSHSILLKSI